MPRGFNRELGKAEIVVVGFLALNPGKNIKEIQKSTETPNYATINNAVHNLKKKGVLREVSHYTSEKGNKVARWGLTMKGLNIVIREAVESPAAVKVIYSAYAPVDPRAAEGLALIRRVEVACGPNADAVLTPLFKFILSVGGMGLTAEAEGKMVMCVLAGLLGDRVGAYIELLRQEGR